MLRIKIATPQETLFNDQSETITVKTIDGVITILPRHVPLVSPIKSGYYQIGDQARVDVSEAMLIVNDQSEVTILITNK